MRGIQVVDLQKSFFYRGETLKVLNGVNFIAEPGSLTCILGPSGSGKSVTLHIIGNLLAKDEGKILIDGKEAEGKSAFRLAFVFQTPRLLPWATVEKNIKYVLKQTGMNKAQMNDAVDEVLTKMDLRDFKKYYPHQISGGMQQRVSLARALALDADVILMDEPFSSLDEITAIALREELIEIWESTRKTILFVTHNIAEACFLGDKIVLLTPKPTKVYKEILIDLERPREFGGEALFDTVKGVFRDFELCLIESRSRKEDFI
jgi:ABC-type nitrate/sulfonate/bicarbonate transport system ATPase subunit